MSTCKVKLCKQPTTWIMKDIHAPLRHYYNPKDGLTSVIVQDLIYSAYCHYHHKIALGMIEGGLNV